uniref:Uncharacterized protein n=1 Tax=viral metagenome TaxID=1070528 RepID=A0A6C0KBH1_9ZZZZ
MTDGDVYAVSTVVLFVTVVFLTISNTASVYVLEKRVNAQVGQPPSEGDRTTVWRLYDRWEYSALMLVLVVSLVLLDSAPFRRFGLQHPATVATGAFVAVGAAVTAVFVRR